MQEDPVLGESSAPKRILSAQGQVLLYGRNAQRLTRTAEYMAAEGFAVSACASEANLAERLTEERPDILVIEGARGDANDRRLIAALRSDPATAYLPIVAWASDGPDFSALGGGPELFDEVISRPVPSSILAARLHPLVRLSTMGAEWRRRRLTSELLHLPLTPAFGPEPELLRTRHILAVTDDQRMVGSLGVGSVGAPSKVDCGDLDADAWNRLLAGSYDGLVLGGAADRNLAVIERIRTHAGLFDLPIVVLHGSAEDRGHEEIYRAGASITLPSGAAAIEVRFALSALERRRRQRGAMRSALHDALSAMPKDELTGLPDASFLDAHGAILARASRSRSMAATLFELDNMRHTAYALGPQAARALMRQVAGWISGMVRAEDTIARCSETEVLIFLPGTAIDAADLVARRIAAILRHTDFGLPGIESPVRPWLKFGTAVFADVESWGHLADRARAARH
ncbi:MAG: diguanylate cyclase domain-containing protein [Alphaproteobacteria bacterium]